MELIKARLTSFWERSEGPRLLTRGLVALPGSGTSCPVSPAVCCCSLCFTSHVAPELACAILSILPTARQRLRAPPAIGEGIKERVGFDVLQGSEEAVRWVLGCQDLRSGVTQGASSWESLGTAGGS